MFVYQIQAEGTLDQVVQARVEGKGDVRDLLMEYYKMKKAPVKGLFVMRYLYVQDYYVLLFSSIHPRVDVVEHGPF